MTSAIIDAILGRLPDVEPIAFSSGNHTANSDRTINTTRHQIGVDGTLTGVEVVIIDGSPSNDLYVRVVLEDDQKIERSTLFRGYVDSISSPNGSGAKPVKSTWNIRLDSWCSISGVNMVLRGTMLSKQRTAGGWSGTDDAELDGKGSSKFVAIADPPARPTGDGGTANEVTQTVPDGALWEIDTLEFTLGTSATTATRRVVLGFADEVPNDIIKITAGTTQTASGGVIYQYFVGAPRETTVAGSRLMTPIPALRLNEGYKFTTTLESGKMGDDYSGVKAQVREWLVT